MASENLDVVIRLRGGRVAAAEARQVEQAIGGIGRASARAAASQRSVAGASTAAGASMAGMAAAAGGLIAALTSVSAVSAGLRFDAQMEQNTIAFTHFLDSTSAVKPFMADLRELADLMPNLGLEAFSTGATRLLAYGTEAEDVTRQLRAMGEAAAVLGGTSPQEWMNRVTTAFGQIQSTGVIQGDEVRQLQEAGINVRKYLMDAGLVTAKQFTNLGAYQIDAAETLRVIMAGMEDDFGGMAKANADSWTFQLGRIKQEGMAAAGAFVKPWFELGKSDVFPYIGRQLRLFRDYLETGGAQTMADNMLTLAGAVGIATAAWAGYRTGALLAAAAQAVLNGALWANPIGLALGLTLAMAVALAILYYKVESVRDGLNFLFETEYKVAKMGYDAIMLMVDAVSLLIDTLGRVPSLPILPGLPGLAGGGGGLDFLPGIDIPGIPWMASGGNIPPGGWAGIRESGAEVVRNRGDGSMDVIPVGRGGGSGNPVTRVLQPLAIDGRVFAEIMVEIGETAVARG